MLHDVGPGPVLVPANLHNFARFDNVAGAKALHLLHAAVKLVAYLGVQDLARGDKNRETHAAFDIGALRDVGVKKRRDVRDETLYLGVGAGEIEDAAVDLEDYRQAERDA